MNWNIGRKVRRYVFGLFSHIRVVMYSGFLGAMMFDRVVGAGAKNLFPCQEARVVRNFSN